MQWTLRLRWGRMGGTQESVHGFGRCPGFLWDVATPSCAEMYYSDQILSQVINEMGNITFVHRKEFNAYPPDFYYDAGHLQNVEPHMKPDPILWWAGVVTFHYVGTGMHGLSKGISMRLLYDLVNSLKH